MPNIIHNVDIHVIDKCNLNCKHCNHFCPLVPEDDQPKSMEYIARNLATLSRYSSIIQNVTLLGGEPFLHPKLGDIIKLTRILFPKTNITIITNGLLCNRLPELAPIINQYNITIQLSKYPIANSSRIIEAFQKYISKDLLLIFEPPSTMGFSYRLLMEQQNNDDERILTCPRRHWCTQLWDEKLYICHYAANLHFLKDYFPDQIHIENGDSYIQLGFNTTPEMVLEFLNTSTPDVCRHCDDVNQFDMNEKIYYYDCEPWGYSKRELDEYYAC